jgi:hypothetical protein
LDVLVSWIFVLSLLRRRLFWRLNLVVSLAQQNSSLLVSAVFQLPLRRRRPDQLPPRYPHQNQFHRRLASPEVLKVITAN